MAVSDVHPAGSDNDSRPADEWDHVPEPALANRSGRRLTIAYASPGWPPAAVSNGIATYVDQMRIGLAAIGHRPLVFTHRVEAANPPPDVVRVMPQARKLAKRALRSLLYRLQGLRAVVRWQADSLRRSLLTLHARTPIDLLEIEETFGLARHLIGRVPFPVVVKMHGAACVHGAMAGDTRYADRWRLDAERAAIETADGVSTPSMAMLAAVREALGRPLPEARVIPNPTDMVPDQDAWTSEESEPGRIVFIGRFDRHKGGDLVVDAFAQLLKRRTDARLTMIGPDPGVLDDGGRRWHAGEYIARALPDPRDRSRVEFLGKQPHDQLNEWRRRAAVVVVPSRYETFGYTVAEAMAMGCPIVASNTAAIPELIDSGRAGRLFDAGHASSLADELLWMLDHPHEAAAMGAAARQTCRTRLSPERVAADAIEHYSDVRQRWQQRRSGHRPVAQP